MICVGILAGGSGTRMGIGNMPKQFLTLGSKPIIIHTIEKFLLIQNIDKIIIGVNPQYVLHMQDLIDKYLEKFANKIIVVQGGKDRNETILNVCDVIEDKSSILITHDAVRPFISMKTIEENISLIDKYDAVDTAVPAIDTIVESINGELISTIPDRKYYYQGQTPQTFRVNDFLKLYSELTEDEKNILTDACKIFVLKDKKVALANGHYSNIKITTVTDLKIASAMIQENYDK